jgi:tight adherence protein C
MDFLRELAQAGWLVNSVPFVLVFAAVVLSVIAVGLFFQAPDATKRRLTAEGASLGVGDGATLRYGEGKFSRMFSGSLRSKLVPSEVRTQNAVRRRLVQAGYFSPAAVPTYYAVRFLLGIGLPLAFAPFAIMLTAQFNRAVGIAAILLIVGYVLPAVFINARIKERQLAAREGLPDALDLMLICIEAGLGLDSAIARIGDEIRTAHPILADQFYLMSVELRAGKTREDSLRNFSDRIGIDEVASLASLLVQTDALGTSLADALRAYSEDMRMRRMLRAENKAQQLSVKMAIPLVIFILPATMIGIMSPALIKIMRVLKTLANG